MIINVTTIVGIFVFLVILAIIINNIRKKGADATSFVLLIIDVSLMLMILFRETTYELISTLGFWRAEIAFLSIISITAFFISVKSYFKQKQLEKEITDLTREIALRKR